MNVERSKPIFIPRSVGPLGEGSVVRSEVLGEKDPRVPLLPKIEGVEIPATPERWEEILEVATRYEMPVTYIKGGVSFTVFGGGREAPHASSDLLFSAVKSTDESEESGILPIQLNPESDIKQVRSLTETEVENILQPGEIMELVTSKK
jgi:hypothetical protein